MVLVRKTEFGRAVRDAVTALAEAAERIAELENIYRDSGYEPGGANEIIDEDMAGLGMVAQNMTNASTFAQNVALFLHGGAPMQFDYASKVNAFRNM